MSDLIQQLFHKDRSIREQARLAIIDMGKGATDRVLTALHTAVGQKRLVLLGLLGELEDLQATPVLIDALRNGPMAPFRVAAAEGLAKIDDVSALDALLDALLDRDTTVKIAAIRALGDYGIPRAIEPLRVMLSFETAVAQEAAWVLGGTFKDQNAADFLLEHPHSARSIDILGQLRERRATQVLVPLLQDPEPQLRAAASIALGHLNVESSVSTLLQILKEDENEMVRAAVATALGSITEQRSIAPLKEALHDHHTVQLAAITALGHLGDGSSIVPLLGLLQSNIPPQTRLAIVKSLGLIGDPAVIPALELVMNHDRDYAVQFGAALALADVAHPNALEVLRNNLRHPNPLLQEAAAKALGLVRDPEAIVPLTGLLKERHPVRQAAAVALLRINIDQQNEALGTLISDLYHPEYDVCWFTLNTLVLFPDQRFVEPVRAVLTDMEPNTRALAAKVLGHIGDEAVIPDLVPYLADLDWSVRRAARLALIRLNHPF